MLTSGKNEWQWCHNFLIFWKNYSIAFKRVVMHSPTINSSVDTDKTVTAQILNKSQWRFTKKRWHKQNNAVIVKILGPILTVSVNL